MRRINCKSNRGVAMLVFVLLLAAGAAYFLVSQLSAAAVQAARDKHDARVLAEAKQALIAYAVTHSDINTPGEYGFLPCPDIDETGSIDEGGSHGTCGVRYENSLGRLPWRTLGIAPLKDSAGECLWYAVSGQYKSSGTSSPKMLNADTNGTFEIYAEDGVTLTVGSPSEPEERPVAVVFAPGESIKAQDRSVLASGTEVCGGNYDPVNYLDAHSTSGIQNHTVANTADATDAFIIGTTNRDPEDYANQYVNDRLIYITREDIWREIIARTDWRPTMESLTVNLAQCLVEYADSNTDTRLPWAAGPGTGPGFLALTDDDDYRDDGSYSDADNVLYGRLADSFAASNAASGATMLSLAPPYPSTTPSSTECSLMTDETLTLWRNWKDHFMYRVSEAYEPGKSLSDICSPLDPDDCVKNVSNPLSLMEYAAGVMFSGPALDGQVRDTSIPSERSTRPLDYLEGENTDEDTNLQSTDAVNPFNDYIVCLTEPGPVLGVITLSAECNL